MMLEVKELGVVADDLTGSCDVAACFASKIGPVEVCLSPYDAADEHPTLQVVNTQSRLESADKAHGILLRVGRALATKKIVFKKIDSALRGSLGAELDGLLEGLNAAGTKWSCAVAPAAPSIGRTTRKGMQCEDGIPLNIDKFSHDPHASPRSAKVQDVLAQTGCGEYLVCDAKNPQDLQRTIDTHVGRGNVVFAGSLGLALALANRLQPADCTLPIGYPVHYPFLVCGSRHALAVRQIEQARLSGIRIIDFDPLLMSFTDEPSMKWDSVVLARIAPQKWEQCSCPPRVVMERFIEAVCRLLKKIGPAGLGVVGGETAFHLLSRLRAKRLKVFARHNEVITGSLIGGGVMDGCPLVCKGGSVGSDNALLEMLSFLSSNYKGII